MIHTSAVGIAVDGPWTHKIGSFEPGDKNSIISDPSFTTSLQAVEEPTVSAAKLADFVGDYWSEELR